MDLRIVSAEELNASSVIQGAENVQCSIDFCILCYDKTELFTVLQHESLWSRQIKHHAHVKEGEKDHYILNS